MSNRYYLEQSMRWFGPKDPVPLSYIAQAGCTGVVSALHHIPVGEVWSVEAIRTYQKIIDSAGLSWTVVESLPVHEDIKKRDGRYQVYIENYKTSLRNLAGCGIKVVTYNFMPVLDWVRTNTAFQLPNGSEALLFTKAHYAIFDLFLLQRPGAERDYPPEAVADYRQQWEQLTETEIQRLFDTMLLSLPGSDEPFTPEQVLQLLQEYQSIDRRQLQNHLFEFLKAIAPVADEVGIQLAIHPDDPPFSVLGLPRILSTSQDIEDLLTAVPNASNGLCFCTGSLGARPDNDLLKIFRQWGSRVYFLHLRNTKRDEAGNFYEANHLEGDADLYALITEVVQLMQREKRRIPMRPDHGHRMLDDLHRKFYPGYSAIGRLKGLAELRGLEYAIQRGTQ